LSWQHFYRRKTVKPLILPAFIFGGEIDEIIVGLNFGVIAC